MKIVHFFMFVIMIPVVGCYMQPQQKPPVLHHYELLVVDVDENPLSGVTIEYTLKDYPEGHYFNDYKSRIVKTGVYITKSNGTLRDSLNVIADPRWDMAAYSFSKEYYSKFDFKVSKEGFYSEIGSLESEYGKKYTCDEPVEKDKITLIRPVDYFNKDFALSTCDEKLKTRILSFIDLIILQGLLTESTLETRSINLISFKSKNYLQIKFTNINVYNSLKLNKYEIGKRIFDEVVRKVLSPLNEYIADSDLFYGYDLTVIGHTKSFAEEYAKSQPVEYRFMIPESVVRKYKNKDISGQQVLDASVILLDDERIELKLQ